MKKTKKLAALLFALLLLGTGVPSQKVNASNVVTKRISEIRKIYPQGSRINKWVIGSTLVKKNGQMNYSTIYNGGCNALVTYVTMRTFHNPYVPGAAGYKNMGTAKTSSTSSMKALFRKAKTGDVVRMYNGSGECHFAIYLSRTGSGIWLYEANFGAPNKVWYNHLWKWKNIKSWAHGATRVSVLRSRNYSKVAAGKAARKYKKGAVFTYEGITYKVIKSSIRGGTVKVIKKTASAGRKPKAIGINKETAAYMKSVKNADYVARFMADMIKVKTYQKVPSTIQDEQFFIVK